MRRRKFIQFVAGTAAAFRPLAVRAQQPSNKIPVVGVLWHASSAEEEDVYLRPLRKAFNDLGYTEGKNIHLEHRFPAENPDRFQTMARELVDLKPDAIIAVTTLGAVDVKKLTDTIPVVFVVVADPIGAGLVEGLAHPGGNATGPSLMAVDLSGKHLALLKEAVSNLLRRNLHRQNTQRRHACRSSGRAANEIKASFKSQNRESAQYDLSADAYP